MMFLNLGWGNRLGVNIYIHTYTYIYVRTYIQLVWGRHIVYGYGSQRVRFRLSKNNESNIRTNFDSLSSTELLAETVVEH